MAGFLAARSFSAPLPPGRLPFHAFSALAQNVYRRGPGVNGRLVETRHPYLDLRVARYLLSLPVVPWCRRKLIMRLAAASLLPNEIVRRLKTPVFDDPMLAHHRQGRFEGLEHPPLSEFSHYVTRWPDLDARSSQALTGTLTPVSLGLWWRGQLLGKNVLEATVR